MAEVAVDPVSISGVIALLFAIADERRLVADVLPTGGSDDSLSSSGSIASASPPAADRVLWLSFVQRAIRVKGCGTRAVRAGRVLERSVQGGEIENTQGTLGGGSAGGRSVCGRPEAFIRPLRRTKHQAGRQ